MAVVVFMPSLGAWTSIIVLALLPLMASAQQRPRVPVPRQIVEHILADSSLFEMMPRSYDSLLANLVAEALDLDGDGTPELEVRGIKSLCGANNCSAWIYRRVTKDYQRLLEAGSIQQIEIQPTTSHGYHDITTAQHGSAWSSELRRYKFDGRQYQLTGCFSRDYRYLEANGRVHDLKRPRITQITCDK